MATQQTPAQAFTGFLNWVKNDYKETVGTKIPNEIMQARYAFEGKQKYPLGIDRMMRLFNKYRPGHYRMENVVIILTDE